ncbi:methylated-DNA--[protein]-cysteine S-methyltransferase [Microbacterium horticulturae]|uniref:Methylated-DNA--[protein]-cysteine S-methyltransferase n=1 Tax=Microbacterium horticulturae TaxID=3028316 RepID=A0ABY8BVY3_9MICO|nr:methylated-DNA--[protein]-cysteine S-methyltransferase [Microbacterium sp. KACC 23027]WEG08060.1 methylated-DNA--[protein]-cysteine S-methyltransferase [Microbacterium sp. KACC 23027]
MTARTQTIDTPDGEFTIIADDDGSVLASGWTGDVPALAARIHPELRPAGIEAGEVDAASAVRAYYAGDLAAITRVPVRQHGTVLQDQGWAALRAIEPGRPLSYTEFAAALARPQAVRAVASICARNAPALFVPCHRVLRGDGSLGGFAWGVDVKRRLLAREASA